jgi:septin family protein
VLWWGLVKVVVLILPVVAHCPRFPTRTAVLLVASAGSKGSGKSTLLNKVFDTDFEVGKSLGSRPKGHGGEAAGYTSHKDTRPRRTTYSTP